MISRRKFIITTAASVVGAAATGAYTHFVEPHWLEFVHLPLRIKNLPENLHGCRLVQISDLHIGPRVDDGYLIRSFRRVDALAPDFVAYTGDFVTFEPDTFTHLASVAAHFPKGRLGTFGVLGNHDYGINWRHPEVAAKITALAGAAGIRMLRNEIVESSGLHIVGLDDLWAGRFLPPLALEKLPRGAAALALSHNPDTADLPGWRGYSGWILAGHTHGGQCKAPFLPPPLLPVRNRRYTSGTFHLPGGRSMYINRGIGHLLEVRFNVRPEISIFHLLPA